MSINVTKELEATFADNLYPTKIFKVKPSELSWDEINKIIYAKDSCGEYLYEIDLPNDRVMPHPKHSSRGIVNTSFYEDDESFNPLVAGAIGVVLGFGIGMGA